MLFGLGSWAGIAVAAPQSQNNAGQAAGADAATQNIQGSWQGVLNSQFGKLRLVLKVSKAAAGTFKATLDSPDQGAEDIPVDTITFRDSYVRFEMKEIQVSFDGGLSRDGTEIAGAFRQGLLSPLVLKRESAGSAIPPPAAGLTRGRIKLDPCNLPIVTKDAGCGKYEVFEDRAAKSGRKIALTKLPPQLAK
jgi:hypothetical protein